MSAPYIIILPPGMLAFGEVGKTFTSVSAFDGYIRELRAQGFTVRFSAPHHANARREVTA